MRGSILSSGRVAARCRAPRQTFARPASSSSADKAKQTAASAQKTLANVSQKGAQLLGSAGEKLGSSLGGKSRLRRACGLDGWFLVVCSLHYFVALARVCEREQSQAGLCCLIGLATML
jgi:hypothetical protein